MGCVEGNIGQSAPDCEPRSVKWRLHKTDSQVVRPTIHRVNINLGRTSITLIYIALINVVDVGRSDQSRGWLITLGGTMEETNMALVDNGDGTFSVQPQYRFTSYPDGYVSVILQKEHWEAVSKAIDIALNKSKQEPVAWMDDCSFFTEQPEDMDGVIPLYTSPQYRELSDDEIMKLVEDSYMPQGLDKIRYISFAKAILRKAQEK